MTNIDFLRQFAPYIPDRYKLPTTEPIKPVLRTPYAPGYVPPATVPIPVPVENQNPDPKPEFVTGSQLRQIMPTLRKDMADRAADAINHLSPQYGLDSYNAFHEFIAQLAVESGELQRFVENLNYSWEQLRKVFPSYFKTDAIAKEYHRQPKRIGDRAYAGRYGNGPESSGDGFKHRGVGGIQVTFKDPQTMYAKYRSRPVDDILELCKTDIYYAIDISMWFFCIHKDLKTPAMKDDFVKVTKGVNPAMVDFAKREKYYNTAKLALPVVLI